MEQRWAGLDLLRGAAAYAVVVSHCHAALSAAVDADVGAYTGILGFAGVEIFFVLSGFLIGGALLRLQGRPGNLGIFVLRRWARTLPVYYLALAVYLAFPLVFQPVQPEQPWRYFVFAQNVFERPYFFGVSWSLAVEEWFYVLLPLLLLFRLRYVHAVLALIVAGAALRFFLDVNPRMAALGRLDAIAYGCLAAWLLKGPAAEAILRRAVPIALAGCAGLAASYLYFRAHRAGLSPLEGTLVFAAVPLCSTLLLPAFLRMRIPAGRASTLVAFGAAVSYPLYVWHLGVIHVLASAPIAQASAAAYVISVIVLSSALAWLTHVLVERPTLRVRPSYTFRIDAAGAQGRT